MTCRPSSSALTLAEILSRSASALAVSTLRLASMAPASYAISIHLLSLHRRSRQTPASACWMRAEASACRKPCGVPPKVRIAAASISASARPPRVPPRRPSGPAAGRDRRPACTSRSAAGPHRRQPRPITGPAAGWPLHIRRLSVAWRPCRCCMPGRPRLPRPRPRAARPSGPRPGAGAPGADRLPHLRRGHLQGGVPVVRRQRREVVSLVPVARRAVAVHILAAVGDALVQVASGGAAHGAHGVRMGGRGRGGRW